MRYQNFQIVRWVAVEKSNSLGLIDNYETLIMLSYPHPQCLQPRLYWSNKSEVIYSL
jgi:hypothetical protein